MQSINVLLNRTDLPHAEADVLTLCVNAWSMLYDLLGPGLSFENVQQQDMLFETFCRFRMWRSGLHVSPEAGACVFLVECILRLVLLDAFTRALEPNQLSEFRVRKKSWQCSICHEELASLCLFTPASREMTEARLDAAVFAWRHNAVEDVWPTVWVEIAYMVVFSSDTVACVGEAREVTTAEDFFLRKAAATSAECVMRSRIRHSLGRQLSPVVTHEAEMGWVLARAAQASDDLGRAVSRDLAATRVPVYLVRLDPDFASRDPTALVGQWLPNLANEVTTECAGGPRTLIAKKLPLLLDVLVLAAFDYTCLQRFKLAWKRLFWTTDQTPSLAEKRLRAYMTDTSPGVPPPLVVTTLDGTYLVQRAANGEMEPRLRFARAYDAVSAWCEAVTRTRGGRVYGGINIAALHTELFASQPATAEPVLIRTQAV